LARLVPLEVEPDGWLRLLPELDLGATTGWVGIDGTVVQPVWGLSHSSTPAGKFEGKLEGTRRHSSTACIDVSDTVLRSNGTLEGSGGGQVSFNWPKNESESFWLSSESESDVTGVTCGKCATTGSVFIGTSVSCS